ncbi:peptidylprolyl isomerase [Emticicia sp. CRIBPO]|uniref:peptidylprolyl isomerase n=1 Tax=Emticicia sp. CRIBPO TaxID=2683258 RepID=UPI0014134CEE|nr:peptidylprolyl isomerase [Emticicia sp. CRIBPO]NBA87461.1 peptidylprolyl isomerase [Emticicia sp. CRIBPO]
MLKKLVLLLFVPLLGWSQDTLNVDKIVAKIDNYYILRSEVESLIVRSKQQQEQSKPINKCQALESLAVQKLLVAKAEIDSVIVEPDVIDNQLTARMQEMVRIYGSEKNIVEQFNKSLETLKSEVRQSVKEQMTAQKMQQTITEKIKITPEEVRKFFNKIPKDSIPLFPSEVMLAQIVKLAKVTKAQKDELIERLNDYKKRVELGEKFETLAKEFSEDQGSKQFGGDLGWAKRGQMVPEFEAAAMKMEPNQISDVIESEFGYHLIQTLEIRGQEYHARHILLRPDYNRLDLTEPKKFLDSLRLEIQKDSIKFEKAAKLYSEDKSTQDTGGLLTDPESGTSKLPLDVSMEPNLYFTVDTMKVGMITAPLSYRSPDGKTGMRIIVLKKKFEPHRANLTDDFEKIKSYALNEKHGVSIDKWFREAVAEVYIKIDPEYAVCKLFEQ